MADQKILVERRFRRTRGPENQGRVENLAWADFSQEHVVVVLGEPGSGKTTEFERQAERDPGASYFSIRKFLRLPAEDSQLRAETLYLDGLDEMRANGGSRHGVLDSIITRLMWLNRPRVRLSCRAADWFGELDRTQLTDVSPSEVVVVEVQPLSDTDVEQIVQASGFPDPAAFLETVRRQRLEDWLRNPQTLELMVEVAKKEGLPDTRTELFEKACAIMAREANRTHRQAHRSSLETNAILGIAGYLCAIDLVAGLGGFADDEEESDSDFPSLADLPFTLEEKRKALGSRLFRWQDGRAAPVHRTIAEFLGARTLRDRIRSGLPLTRVLRLITGHDGGTLSDLRGLYAWLTTLLPEQAEVLAARDPVALIFYGDPEPLPSSVKRAVFRKLEALADQNPLFFYEGGSSHPFGALADPDLAHDFRDILSQTDRSRFLHLTVLAILAYGRPLEELRPDLLRVVYGQDSPPGIRELGTKALSNVSDAPQRLLLLEDVHQGKILDPDDGLRAHLLEQLYPDTLGPRDIVPYLTARKSKNHYGQYYTFLRKALLARTDDGRLPSLLDAMNDPRFRSQPKEDRPWPQLIGSLLRRGLDVHGDSISAERLWSWLEVGQGKWHTFLKHKDQVAIGEWFSVRPERVTEMYQWFVQQIAWTPPRGVESFWDVVHVASRPPELWRWQLSAAEAWPGHGRGDALFRSVVSAAMAGADHPSLEELYDWVEKHPSFRQSLDTLVVSPYHSPYIYKDPQGEARDQEEERQEAARRSRDRVFIERNIDRVRAGQHDRILIFLAELFLELADHSDQLGGFEGIRKEFDDEVVAAAESGFLALLERKDLPNPEEIGEKAAQRKLVPICLPVLVGVILRHRVGSLPALGESLALRNALALEFAWGVYEPGRWFEEVLEQNPGEAAKVILAAWTPLLQRNSESIPHLHHVDEERFMVPVAQEIGLQILRAYPRSNAPILGELMRAALVGASREDLVSIVSAQLSQFRGLKEDQILLWLSLSLLIAHPEGIGRARSYLQGRKGSERAVRLTVYLRGFKGISNSIRLEPNAPLLAALVRLLGPKCPPQRPPDNGWTDMHPFEASQFVGRLIDALGNHLTEEGSALLGSLRNDRSIAAWKDRLSHIAEQQRRRVREERYQRPSLQEALKILEGGEPTSLPDLHAIVCDQLRTLTEEIEKGSESGYQSFWNVKGHEELDSPVPENEARNRLRTRLNPKLMPLGISAEIEGHYTGNNRSDFKVAYRSMNIPVEIKKSDHRQVWTAPRHQLKAKYSIDPGARGFGVYLVFWFGAGEGKGVPKPPAGVDRPSTAAEMEAALRQLYSGEDWKDTEIICIDCSRRNKR